MQQMSSVDNGFALWDPQAKWVKDSANDTLARPYPHIRPGDVGYVDKDGGFIRLFDTHPPEDHSDQETGPFGECLEPIQQDMGCLQLKTIAYSIKDFGFHCLTGLRKLYQHISIKSFRMNMKPDQGIALDDREEVMINLYLSIVFLGLNVD